MILKLNQIYDKTLAYKIPNDNASLESQSLDKYFISHDLFCSYNLMTFFNLITANKMMHEHKYTSLQWF